MNKSSIHQHRRQNLPSDINDQEGASIEVNPTTNSLTTKKDKKICKKGCSKCPNCAKMKVE